ncbi:hypothetical protein ACEWY4_019635 [Coilia grayii]|uniref:Flagellar FliJ protein n=1 Tax=Coilia grayii TaxID=363190 RepID=A0ABD1JAH4_9TELE
MVERIAVLESIRNVTQKAEFECSAQASSAKALELWQSNQRREAQLAQQALILVRRTTLAALLKQEEEQYRRELQHWGLAMYKQRV